jgi:NADH-quinone oxidoreductase subunit J
MIQVVFYIFAAVAVIAAVNCILQRSPVASALWLVQTMLALAGIYFLLNAQFIGIIQVLVYAGAVMVLFLFVIMLLSLGRAGSDMRGPSALAATLVVVGLLAVALGSLWAYTPRRLAEEVASSAGVVAARTSLGAGAAIQQATAARGVVGGVAAPLFETYLIPFEITSVLLLAAIVGAVVLAKRKV